MKVQASKFISPKDLKRLLNESKKMTELAISGHAEKRYINDYFIFAIAAYTGLRISELASLEWRDVGEDYLVVRKGKGGKAGTVYFGRKTSEVFETLRCARNRAGQPSCDSSRIFVGIRGPMTRHGLHERFKHWRTRLGLRNGIGLHSLRHAYAVTMIENGISLSLIRDQLRHSNIAVTSTYLSHTKEARSKLQELL